MDGLTVAESGNAALSLAMRCSTWAGLSITSDPRSGSRRGLLDLSGFPVPRQEFVEALGWVIGQPLQNISQPGVRVDVIEFGRLDQGVDRPHCSGSQHHAPIQSSAPQARVVVKTASATSAPVFP